MPVENNNSSEQDLRKAEAQSGKVAQTGVQGAKKTADTLYKNRRLIVKGAKKATEIGIKVGEFVVEKGGELIAFLAANPMVLAVLAIILAVIIVVLMFNAGWMHLDTFGMKPYLFREDKDRAYEVIVGIVAEKVEESYELSIDEAEKYCEAYIEDNYDDYDNDEVTVEVMTDSLMEIAEHITPYIVSVNGAIQYEVDDPGLDRYGKVVRKNEYNTIGNKFKEVVEEYASSQMFYIDTENIVDEVELETEEIPVLDEFGNQRYDEFGNEMTRERKYYTGTVYIGIGYFIGDYKKEDIDEAVENLYNKRYELTHTSYSQYAEWVDESIYDMIYEITGTREYSPWGGYGQGILPVLRNWANIDFSDLMLTPGSIEALLQLGTHGISADYALLQLLEEAQASGKLTMKSRTSEGTPYCTEWVHFFMYVAYGRDFDTNPKPYDNGDGNGRNMAYTLALRYDDWYTPADNMPTAGSVYSIGGAGNHVGIITKVEGDRIWYCDGNVGDHGVNTRLNQSASLSDFINSYNAEGKTVTFANHR